MERRTTFTGPENSLPFTRTVWLSFTNSNCSTAAPMDACQGNPFRADATTSRAAGVSRDTTPDATRLPSWTRIALLCPTPLPGSCAKRIGRDWDGMARPARSTTTG